MSVHILSADELSNLVAIATKLKLASFATALQCAELISRSNCAAYAAQYNETETPVDADELERLALGRLARQDFRSNCFGGFLYNCITNEGELYLGELNCDRSPSVAIAPVLSELRAIEEMCREYFDAESRRLERQAEDDAAYVDVGPLPKMSADELRAEMEKRGASALIVAEFRVDESDCQTDYFGGRSGREVVIGFRTGKRESFKQLRAAAGKFPPTADLGPGCDVWTARVVFTNDVTNNGNAYWKGCASHWHDDIGNGTKFMREEDTRAFVASAPSPESIHFSGVVGHFKWELSCESVEHRENYSMGGGNYLGHSRYSGWQVSSTTYISGPMEYFEAPTVAGKSSAKRTPKPVPVETVPTVAELYSVNL